MEVHPFYTYSLLVVQCIVSFVLLASALVGYSLARLSRQRTADTSEIGTIQASMLGMLGLLLGFTFAVASSRYDTRRVLAIDEANALGTTFMRTQMLPEPYRTSISKELRDYIDLRLRAASVLGDQTALAGVKRETEKLQQTIWKQATAMARKHDTPISAVFVTSLNQSIDLYASRVATFYARVPSIILWILLCIAIAALGMVGFGFGIGGQRDWLVMAVVSIMVASVIVMIVDLDRPEAGPTRISQQTMVDLKNSLSGYQ